MDTITLSVNHGASFGFISEFTTFLMPEVVENPTTLTQCVSKPVEKSIQISIGFPQAINLLNRVQNRCVVLAAELSPDLRQRGGSQFF